MHRSQARAWNAAVLPGDGIVGHGDELAHGAGVGQMVEEAAAALADGRVLVLEAGAETYVCWAMIIQHPDGSAEIAGVPESKHRELDQRVLHRATCETLKDHDDQYQMICGTRGELEDIMEEYDKLCPACL